METNVYINGREACSRASDGKSAGAFPDPCWSPPPPPTGPVVVPYSNTAYARDLQNGTATVFICKSMVAQKDRSYFSTSEGNVPATPGFQKGVASHVIKGKAYFKSWSPNVKFEGLEVPRHEDLMTHNHGSTANTPPMYYRDSATVVKECAKQQKKVEERCKPDNEHHRKRKGVPQDRNNDKSGSWVLDHCGPLLLKPGLEQFGDWSEEWENIDSLLEKAKQELEKTVINKLEEEITEYGVKKVGKLVARRALTGWIPVVGWVMTAYDVVSTGIELYETIPEMKKELEELKDISKKMDEAIQKFEKYKDKIKNFKNLSEEEQKSLANEIMAETQAVYALSNRCLRARKCLLVPYNKTGKLSNWEGKGCCPGQTGHHLLADTMFRDQEKTIIAREEWNKDPSHRNKDGKLKRMPRDKYPTKNCWREYKEGKAPTICLEGKDNHTGSHGAMHATTAKLIKASNSGKEMNYVTARDMVIDEVALMYGCDKSCLKAQLDKAYQDAYTCGDLKSAKINADAGDGVGKNAEDI
ncbi:PAAR-like domain-containing protein [Escherichia sp. E4694]|uniref:PAAR-like domain-containing protein n=1 Tax=Escherichia sp. E4694 TaxID=2044464 RepID=UPI001F0F5D46|nr:PAAR-like domain-containing protein [Escherichia sp. E4694]